MMFLYGFLGFMLIVIWANTVSIKEELEDIHTHLASIDNPIRYDKET